MKIQDVVNVRATGSDPSTVEGWLNEYGYKPGTHNYWNRPGWRTIVSFGHLPDPYPESLDLSDTNIHIWDDCPSEFTKHLNLFTPYVGSYEGLHEHLSKVGGELVVKQASHMAGIYLIEYGALRIMGDQKFQQLFKKCKAEGVDFYTFQEMLIEAGYEKEARI